MESFFNNKGIFQLLIKWKYHLIIIMVISVIAAIIFSSPLFIKPKFKSEAIVYPVNLGEYSEESHSEQMQQILLSQEIKDSVIKRHNLAKHYGIDPNDKYFLSTLYYEYGKNIKINKTEFESIRITVLDTDPQKACDIVKSILEFYDKKTTQMQRLKYNEVVTIKSNELKKKHKEIKELQKKMQEYEKNHDNLNYNIQIDDIDEGDIKLITGGEQENSKSLEKIKNLYEYISYARLKQELDKAIEESEKEITYYQLVSSPYPADKKTTPVRWVIVLLSAIGTFFMSLVIISIIESTKKIQTN